MGARSLIVSAPMATRPRVIHALLPAFALVAAAPSAFAAGARTAPAGGPAPAGTPAQPPARPRLLPVVLILSDNAVGQAAQVAYVVESAARRSARHTFAEPVEVLDPLGTADRRDKGERGRDALAFGRRALDNLEPGSLESFDRAVQTFEESNLWETIDLLGDALVMRILARWGEDPIGTRREIARLLGMLPKKEFPAELTPPDLAAEITRTRELHAAEPRCSLDVNTSPVAARVYLDGVYRGTAPTSVRGLVAGEHYLSLVAPGYTIVQKKVRAGPGSTATEVLVPAERARPYLSFLERMQKGFGTGDEVLAARTLARTVEVDELFVAGVRRASGRLQIELHRLAARDGHALGVAGLEMPEKDPQFAASLDEAATKLLSRDQPRGVRGEPMPLKGGLARLWDSVDTRTARIATGAGAAALLVAGGVVGVLAYMDGQQLRRMTQNDPKTEGLAGTVFGEALASDVMVGAGLVMTGVWAWLQFGATHAKKTDLVAPPVLEDPGRRDTAPERPPDPHRPDSGDDDPFGSLEPVRAPDPGVFARLLGDGVVAGIGGRF